MYMLEYITFEYIRKLLEKGGAAGIEAHIIDSARSRGEAAVTIERKHTRLQLGGDRLVLQLSQGELRCRVNVRYVHRGEFVSTLIPIVINDAKLSREH